MTHLEWSSTIACTLYRRAGSRALRAVADIGVPTADRVVRPTSAAAPERGGGLYLRRARDLPWSAYKRASVAALSALASSTPCATSARRINGAEA